MKKLGLLIPVLLAISLLGCEKAADTTSPVKYEKQKISFTYPGNWKVTDDVTKDEVRYLFVESPGAAIFIVQVYSKKDAVSLAEFAEWFSKQTKQEISVASIAKNIFSSIEMEADDGDRSGIKEKFSIELLGEKIPHVREYYSASAGDKVVFLISQTATEDMAKVKPGFRLIMNSFTMN